MLHLKIKFKKALSGSAGEGLRTPSAAIGAAIGFESDPERHSEAVLKPFGEDGLKVTSVCHWPIGVRGA
jgi:hypothetical protein